MNNLYIMTANEGKELIQVLTNIRMTAKKIKQNTCDPENLFNSCTIIDSVDYITHFLNIDESKK
jgi:hypothetical protein